MTDMDRFYASWNDGIRGKAKKIERIKGFVKFCMKRKWLSVQQIQARCRLCGLSFDLGESG